MTTTTAPAATVTNLVGADWAAMHHQASAATTAAEADRTVLRRDAAGPPGSLTVEVDWPAGGRARLYVGSLTGAWMATYVVFGPPAPLTEPMPGDADDIAAHIVESVRIRDLPGGRAPGRPPAAITTIAGMNARKRMVVACELCESGGFSQTAAASYAGVSRESLNRRLRARRLERLTLGHAVDDGGHGVRIAPVGRPSSGG
jgi:hypothetical protein